MKKLIWGLALAALASCEYKDIVIRKCFLASEQTISNTVFYSYNSKNELISYSASNISSSILTYDGSGKIISELDNGTFQITYDYDQNNRLILWSETIIGFPSSSIQTKFIYNSAGQDTLRQFYKYDVPSSSYYLRSFIRSSYSSTGNNNYSQRRTYDAASNLLFTENFLWDNHPNPYLTNAFFANEPPPSNNIIQYTYVPAGGSSQVTNFTYAYNTNGFPLNQKIVGYDGTTHTYSYANCK